VAIDPCKRIDNGVASKLFLLADHLEMTAGYKEDPELPKKMHHPKEFVGSMDSRNGGRAAGEKLLRTNEKYLDFLALFGKFGCNAKTFKNYFWTKRFREMVGISMEAFLVTVYTNNYELWNQEDKEGGMRQVKLSGRKRKQDCSGWTDAGVDLFDDLAKEIKVQRTSTQHGAGVDIKLQEMMTEMSSQGEGGGRVQGDETVLDGENDFAEWMEISTGEKGVPV
jgi:hypothetical protein